MRFYMVEYEVRKHGAIGIFDFKSDIILADDADDARKKFREKHEKDWELRSPTKCEVVGFTPTHRYLNLKTGNWDECEFIRYYGVCDAEVKKADGKTWIVGRSFLERL